MTDELKGTVELILPTGKNLTKLDTKVQKKDLAKYWDASEINYKLGLIDKPKDKMLCIFLWMTGVRVTEALSVRKQDIDFKNYMIRIRWLKSRKYNERMLPIHPTLKMILEAYVGGFNQEDLLFPYTRINAYRIVRKWFAGHPHQFRHSFAVNWLKQGGRLEVLHRVLGHKSLQATMEYTKIVPVDQAQELYKIRFD